MQACNSIREVIELLRHDSSLVVCAPACAIPVNLRRGTVYERVDTDTSSHDEFDTSEEVPRGFGFADLENEGYLQVEDDA